MDLHHLLMLANECSQMLSKYAFARRSLVHSLLETEKVPGGPWRGKYRRKEDPTAIPLDGNLETTPDGAIQTGTFLNYDRHPHRQFYGFQLVDPEDKPPAAGSPGEIQENKCRRMIENTRDAVNMLLKLLPELETVHIDDVDTQPLTRLRIALPPPPYVPIQSCEQRRVDREDRVSTKQIEREGAPSPLWESIVVEERKLIDEVNFILHRMVMLAQPKEVSLMASHPVRERNPRRSGEKQKDNSRRMLSQRQHLILQTLLELKAVDFLYRRTNSQIALKAEGVSVNVKGYVSPLANLVARKLVNSRLGRDGGFWLTARGAKLAAKL